MKQLRMVMHAKRNSTDAQQLFCIALGSRYTLGPGLRAQRTLHSLNKTLHVLRACIECFNRHVVTCLLGSVATVARPCFIQR